MMGSKPDFSLPVVRQATNVALRDIVFVLFRRRWIVLAISLPIIILGGISLFRQTGSFTASARVVVELNNVDIPRWNTANRVIDFDRELSTLFTLAMSLPVAETAAEALRDSIPVIKQLDPKLIGIEDPESFQGFLLRGLDVSIVGESNVLDFRFTSVNPRLSLMAVEALRNAFLDYEVYGRKNKQAVQFYTEQMSNVRGQIDSLLARRGEIHRKSKYISLEDELKFDSGRLANLRTELSNAQVDRRILESRYDQLATYLAGDPRDFPIGSEESKSSTLIGWRSTVGKHDDELASILTVFTPNSAAAQKQVEIIQTALGHLAAEERSYVQSIKVAVETTRRREAAIQAEIDQILLKSEEAPQVYQQVSLIDTEISSLRGLLDDIQGKLGEVRLSEFADERVSTLVPLSQPMISSVLSSGKTLFYFLLIVLFSIALGVVVAFIMESLDHRVYEPRDVELHLQLPVFASVTKAD